MSLLEDRQRTSAPVTREEHQQLVQAFERTPSLFKLLSSVRTRRMGKGFTIETGVEEIHPVTGRPQLMAKGPCECASQPDAQPLSEIEEALIRWAAGGPNGTIAMDLPTQADVATFLCVAGRTIPGPRNDPQAPCFIGNASALP